MKTDDSAKKRQQRERRRHKRFFYTVRILAARPIERSFGFKAQDIPEIEGNYLLLSNHNTDLDFVFVGSSMKQHMYFVASEHVYQKGFASKLLKYFFAPIARLKGTNAASTVMTIMRSLRSGDNVCIFAEGNRSYNGETCPILFSTGKLARSSGASLVTYRLEGGYLTTPRWSYTRRRGRMTGRVMNVYTPEQLKDMTNDEINSAINSDLYENAYERQQEWNVPYKGKRLAEGLEHILFLCPKCGRISSITTDDDHIRCECGLDAVYNEYGLLDNSPYRTVLEWDNWQKRCLRELVRTADGSELFGDDNVSLFEISDSHEAHLLGSGRLSMTVSELTAAKMTFSLSEIDGMAVYGRSTIVLSSGGIHYELRPAGRMCAVKYLRAYSNITGTDDVI